MKTISLVMCVKNEEKGLEKAIQSCRSIVNEIIVSVDKSTTDNTLEIAKKFADKVLIHEFTGDFAAMRNEAHKHAKCDYILFLDGHEYIKHLPDSFDFLDFGASGYLTTIRMENGAEFRNPRIYKNGVQFDGAVHEKLQCDKVIDIPDFVIQHDRINGQDESSAQIRIKQREQHTPLALHQMLEKDPKNLRALFHLAMHYIGIGDNKGAIRFSKLYLKYSNLPQEKWFVRFQLALNYFLQNKMFRAFWHANRLQDEMPNRWENFKLLGLISTGAKKPHLAVSYFLQSFRDNKNSCAYKPWPRDDAATMALLAGCYYVMKSFENSKAAYRRAAELASDEKLKKAMIMRADFIDHLTKK